MYLLPLNGTLQMVKVVDFMVCVFYHNFLSLLLLFKKAMFEEHFHISLSSAKSIPQ